MSKEDEFFRKVLKRQLEGMGLSPKEVEKGLHEADEFTDGLDEVLDSMFPVNPNPTPVKESDDDFPLGAIL